MLRCFFFDRDGVIIKNFGYVYKIEKLKWLKGSIEAIIQALNGIESEKVELDILSTDVGNVTVNDVNLASASNGIILGFY